MTSKKPTLNLTKRFLKGLELHNLTYEEIKNNNWKYCGGNTSRHLNYYKLCYKEKTLPDYTSNCVCGHHIKENCYITDGKEFLVLGNCCIKKFIPKGKSGRTCDTCGKPHRNRVVNRCHTCRFGVCDSCSQPCNPDYKKCYNCNFN